MPASTFNLLHCASRFLLNAPTIPFFVHHHLQYSIQDRALSAFLNAPRIRPFSTNIIAMRYSVWPLLDYNCGYTSKVETERIKFSPYRVIPIYLPPFEVNTFFKSISTYEYVVYIGCIILYVLVHVRLNFCRFNYE